DPARALARRAQFADLGHAEVALFSNVAEMFDKVPLDAVDLATRPESHTALVTAAAARGLHVLCQKPLAASLEEAAGMVNICRTAGVRFMVNEMWRYLPWFRDLRSLLGDPLTGEGGRIGPAHYLRVIGPRRPMNRSLPVHENQPYFAEMPRLIIYEMYLHWIDAARSLLGEVETVYARGGRMNPLIKGEDWAALLLGHRGGATSLLESSWAAPGDRPELTREGDVLVEGVDGALHFDPVALELRLIRPAETGVVARYEDLGRSFQRAFDGCIGHFAAAVRYGLPFESSAEDNLRTLAATFAAYDSLEWGTVARVDEVGG
ncbi:MAG TPA: Gfo/Idh/MocA family oxidoreductase, partial [Chloroflexota bacterium]|nr:Gfo/Idh/MocA family oxidoreductase [Chloroflexota bacterium]